MKKTLINESNIEGYKELYNNMLKISDLETKSIINTISMSVIGFIVPVILKKVNVDPALASAVFVTTVTDVLGFFFFLGLATIFISYLN